jgi:hypothetical protein
VALAKSSDLKKRANPGFVPFITGRNVAWRQKIGRVLQLKIPTIRWQLLGWECLLLANG